MVGTSMMPDSRMVHQSCVTKLLKEPKYSSSTLVLRIYPFIVRNSAHEIHQENSPATKESFTCNKGIPCSRRFICWNSFVAASTTCETVNLLSSSSSSEAISLTLLLKTFLHCLLALDRLSRAASLAILHTHRYADVGMILYLQAPRAHS